MQWFKNLKVGAKIGLLGLGSIIMMFVVGIMGYYFLNESTVVMNHMYNDNLMAVQFVNDSRVQGRKIEADMYAILAAKQHSLKEEFQADINRRVELFNKNAADFAKIKLNDNEQNQYKKVMEDLKQYRQVRGRVIDLSLQDKNEEAFNLFIQQGRPLADKFSNDLKILSSQVKQSADELNTQNKSNAQFVKIVFTIIILVSMVIIVGLSVLIIKQITNRLNDFIKYLEILAQGDFSKNIAEESLQDKTEFGSVSRAVDKMKNSIYNLIRTLSGNIEQLAASSEQLTASSEQSAQASDQIAGAVSKVAAGSEKQLEAANNTSSIVEQISIAINQVAVNTETVANSAESTASAASDGEDAIKKAVNQMNTIEVKTNATAVVIGELEEKSKQIGQIVDVISNIAGQTNLLALNAAIEAARAGEAGKGFAVVAEEVRKLAEQSQDAAKQITELIGEVQAKTDNAVIYMNDGKKEVDMGARVVEGAGTSFEKILSMVKNMTGQIHEISAAVQEITSSSQDVVKAVDSIDDETKKNSAQTQTISASTEEQSSSVEEIATASEHLAKMAEQLEKEVSKFKI
ncbi:methyl-accepting chemotaxis protein [Pectinatus sottacetonis]|uniref:methyl-accepting chemotaxis protein n=1 Tax=Pectinatus sottacetonis TaxID=1002795 RepID=UPI001E2BF8E1|nr:methyl-accepting chemotaxis protein [Pectinatus sottacetonis]